MDEIEEIKRRLDIAELISGYLTLKKAGVNLKGLCPFHNEKTPSFMVSPERQTFKCFGCNEGGDIFTFIEKIEGLDFYNTLKLLADRAGVKLERQTVQRGGMEYGADRKTELFSVNDWAKKVYHKLLLDHPKSAEARAYLKKRGLSQATIEEFEIGYAPDSWDYLIRFLESKGYAKEIAFQAGLLVQNSRGGYYDRFRDRVMFPINSIMGATIGFTSRVLKDDAKEAKYINSSESPIYTKGETLYGLDKAKLPIKEANLVVIVEGQMDVISCHQAGFRNVVASSGTALTQHHLKILSRYASELAFCFDSDQAGQTAMKRAVILALQNDVSAKIVSLPSPFKDPDEAIKNDPLVWKKAIQESNPALEYWVDLLIKEAPEMSVAEKKKIAKEIIPVIKIIYSEIEKEHYVHYLAQKLTISEDAIIRAMEKTKNDKTARPEVQNSPTKKDLSLPELLLGLLWFEPDLISLMPAEIIPLIEMKGFDSLLQMVRAGRIEREKVAKAEALLMDQIVIQISDELDLSNPETTKAEFIFNLKRLQSKNKERTKIEFAKKIEEAESRGDKDRIRELVNEYATLIKEAKDGNITM